MIKKPESYILGKTCFYGFEFRVTKDTLIPRPETELLTEIVLKKINEIDKPVKLVDVGTGSGCIAITLFKETKEQKDIKIFATDISEKALKVAKNNAKKHKAKVKFLKGDILNPLKEKIDVIVTNLPYVSDKEYENLPPEVKNFEPKLALWAGKDGLLLYNQLLRQAKEKLKKNGLIFLEISPMQEEKIKKLIKNSSPKCEIKIYKDYAGLARIVEIKNYV